MKKALLVILMLFTFLHSAGSSYNEHKVDLYYANGIMMMESEDDAENTWGDRTEELLFTYPRYHKQISESKVAYNKSYGMTADVWEAFLQKKELEPSLQMTWQAFTRFLTLFKLNKLAYWIDKAGTIAKNIELDKQVADYKESLKKGHGVIVVAHSQGNLFTTQAYQRLLDESEKGWMGKYFHTIAVASPAQSQPINSGKGVTFDNDMVTLVGTHANNITNPNRADSVYYKRNAAGEIISDRILERNVLSKQYHSFSYYLGYPVYEEILKSGSNGKDAITNKEKFSTNKAKDKIIQYIREEIDAHTNRASQWEINKEFDKNSCNYRVMVKHKFDPAMEIPSVVFPFNRTKKIYKIPDIGYVIASDGGKKVLDEWEGKNDNECMMLDNPQREMLSMNQVVKFYHDVTFEYGFAKIFHYSNEEKKNLVGGYDSLGYSIKIAAYDYTFKADNLFNYFVTYGYYSQGTSDLVEPIGKGRKDIKSVVPNRVIESSDTHKFIEYYIYFN